MAFKPRALRDDLDCSLKLTQSKIAKLHPDKSRRYSFSDGNGLQLTVFPSGRRSWVCRFTFDGAPRVLKLGNFPEMSLARARSEALFVRRQAAMGHDPVAAHRTRQAYQRITFKAFAEEYLQKVVAHARKNPASVKRLLERELLPRLGDRQLTKISDLTLRELIFRKRDAGKPEAAAAIRNLLKRIYDYAFTCGIVSANPIARVPLKYIVRHRVGRRALTEQELKCFYNRLYEMSMPNALALEFILLTLARKGELLSLRWKHINFEKQIWELPAELSKTGDPHIVYLSTRALEILKVLSATTQTLNDSEHFVFPAQSSKTQPLGAATWNKAIERVRWGIPRFTPHDLRRTAATLLNEKGYNENWIEKAMNHAVKGIKRVYNRAQYAAERKQMLQDWADYLEGLK